MWALAVRGERRYADGLGAWGIVVLDHPRQVPGESRERVPDHLRGGGADRHESGGGVYGPSDAISGELGVEGTRAAGEGIRLRRRLHEQGDYMALWGGS